MELARRAQLEELKNALRQVAGKPAVSWASAPPIPTGWDQVDAVLLPGGLPRGRVTQVTGSISSGKTALVLTAAGIATMDGLLVAYIDARREFYPPSAAEMGVDLDRLLVVRARLSEKSSSRAAEILAQSRAFALVVLDLPCGQRLPENTAARLRAAAHEGTTALVVVTTHPGAVASASLKLNVATQGRPRRRSPPSLLPADDNRRSPPSLLPADDNRRSPPSLLPADDNRRSVVVTLQKGGIAPPGTSASLALEDQFWPRWQELKQPHMARRK